MKNPYLRKIITVLSCALFSAAFIVLLFFCAPAIDGAPEAVGRSVTYNVTHRDENGKYYNEEITAAVGEDFTAVSITDLDDLKKITKVNYVADEFVKPCKLSDDIQIVDLEKPFEFAEKGTLILVVLSPDPEAEDYDAQAERLAKYKIGNNWKFTMSLPKIFSASNVYLKTALVARHGNIENYDFINFNDNYDVKTDSFSDKTENTTLDLSFYTRRVTMDETLNAAQIITVHYQSAGGAFSGITDCPLIGTETAVKKVRENSSNLLIAFTIIAFVVFAVLAVMSVIKRTKEFAPSIVWVLGIAILLLSRFLLAQSSVVPLLWVALWLSSSFAVLGGACLSVGVNFGKAPTKYIFPALAAVGALFAFIRPFIPFGAASAMNIVCLCLKAICTVALLGFIGLAAFRKADRRGVLQLVCAAIIAVAVCASLFMPQIYPSQINPLFWLCTVTVVMTFVSVFIVFRQTEKTNEYLTANLQKEVERQVKDIKSVIEERDNLLRFVSHDMKKPLSSAVMLCNTAIGREKDGEQIKTINIIKQDAERVIDNLTEIAAYAKLNYIAEPSQSVDMLKLCALFYKYHKFDCDANGIILKNTASAPVKAFVKQKGIESVVSNLIINAIEHANCTTVTISLKAVKNKIILSIADDGKGIDESLDVFRPYVSENDGETGGLGLYICKNIIESMNGELTYETGPSGTTFHITLLKA